MFGGTDALPPENQLNRIADAAVDMFLATGLSRGVVNDGGAGTAPAGEWSIRNWPSVRPWWTAPDVVRLRTD
jgi:hypothetical protein